MRLSANCFNNFQSSIADYSLPKRFTFPFYYEPHPLCLLAAKELQQHLVTQTDWEHNFGLTEGKKGLVIGKMFGVLVVQNEAKEIGYLSAFSGKLADANHHPNFVPPVFDMLKKDGFFKKEEAILNQINRDLEILEQDANFLECQQRVNLEKLQAQKELAARKQSIKDGKKERKARRKLGEHLLDDEGFIDFKEVLRQESLKQNYFYKDFKKQWNQQLEKSKVELDEYLNKIDFLKKERKEKSNALQQRLFSQYQFVNVNQEWKSLGAIFEETAQKKPPAAAGECAAPKLLQYAFLNQLKPIAIAEFWWGQPLKSAIRKKGHFYPACRSKCEPILAHMLEGTLMDENPMLTNPAIGKTLSTVYEDDHLLVINKPTEFLSVPGKNIRDSVLFRIKKKYPTATGPLVVHRLDMSTSGLMLIAKTKDAHKYLQYQFIKRFIKKRYVALLDGIVKEEEGIIDLPLRVDLDNRPHQLVCYEHGKSARTKWQVLERKNGQTRIHFFPITGRTHQLRVHASHSLGLNCPIIGDDLYGIKGKRLNLHAESIEFTHPISKEIMKIQVDAEF